MAGTAAASDRWLHVRVQEFSGDEETVSINVPLQLVEALLPTINTNEFSGGKIRLGSHDEFEELDLREMLAALRDAPDADFVTVRSKTEQVRVAKENGFLLVNVDEQDGGDRVRVRMPLEVVEAMLSAGETELDLMAALAALAEYDAGDLITVESDDSHVRIWIDGSDVGE